MLILKKGLFYAFLFLLCYAPLFAQNIITLDEGITNSFEYLNQRIPENTKIAIISIQSNHPDLSDYIITRITALFVNSNKYTIVERRNLTVLENELNFNMSGMVSDETAQNIGKMIGAQSVITGNITALGDVYKFDLNIIEVETARIQGIFSVLILEDQIFKTLIGRNISLGQSFIREQRNMTYYWLYLGIIPSFGLHFYNTDDSIYNNANYNGSFDIAAHISIRPIQYLAIQIEPTFTIDSMVTMYRENVYDSNNVIKYFYDTNYTFNHNSLLLPILIRGIFDYRSMAFSGLIGGYISLPLGSIEQNNSFTETNKTVKLDNVFGLMCGVNFGIKIGQGHILFDVRYAIDFSDTYYNDINIYKRSILFLGIGYEIGFIQNNSRRNN